MHLSQTARALVLGSALTLSACSDDAATTTTDTAADATSTADATASDDATTAADAVEADADPYIISTSDRVTVSDLGGGARRGKIDATSETEWVQLALGSGEQVETAEGWDLSFRRIEIHAARPVAAVDQAFEAVTQAPAEGWVEDTAEASAFEQLGEWWSYNPSNHTVAPKEKTFFVKVDEQTYFKLAVRDYYDDAGSTGLVTLDWAPVAAP